MLEEQHGQRRRPNDAERLRQAREAAVIAAADLEPGHSAAELARVLGVGERTVKRRRRLARAAVRAVLEGS